MSHTSLLTTILAFASLAACSSNITPGAGDYVKGEGGKPDSSAEAVFLDFEFDGEFVTNSVFNPEGAIEDQLLYTIGHLNGDRSVGRLDKLELTNVDVTDQGGKKLVRYHAKMPVAWGKKNSIPSSYTLTLPSDMSYSALSQFATEYGHDCVEAGAHDIDQGSMWYYFRPERSGCEFAAGAVVEASAAVSLSSINTTGKYPEYHKVWEDEVLKVVAVFGKYEDGATSGDSGIYAYSRFARGVRNSLPGTITTVPAQVPSSPGVETPEIIFRSELADGKQVEIVTMLVDNIRTAPPEFNARYEELSGSADLIVYNGHAGLGANIRELARKGDWKTGQYSIVFMNGCDTYAYVDASLADAHAAVNADDPTGYKYMDIVTNAMPSFFHSMPNATLALVNGLLSYDDPMTYESMFRNIDSSEVVLVSGEQDNVYVPGYGEDDSGDDGDSSWNGLLEEGVVAASEEHRFETPVLAAGEYKFEIDGTADADLYVRVGAEPSVRNFDCRPYLTGSKEECTVSLNTPATIHLMVRGWKPSSEYTLIGQ